jgi:Sec-independent protein translocase protein TatA
MEIIGIILLIILVPVIMIAIGASQLAKASQTLAELKRIRRK